MRTDTEASEQQSAIARLREIMHTLRSPGGCPWDIEQTHESLIPNVIEEAYEVAAAIRSGNREHMEEELGDLLLQVVFHGEMASETGAFDFDSICHAISDKLVRRHPHVFGDSEVDTTDGVLRQWDEIKAQEKGDQPARYLDKVGEGFPGLLRAKEIQKKVAKVGFDWDNISDVLAKVHEEMQEVEVELAAENQPRLEEEIGDLLFSVVNLARKKGIDAEAALAATNEKFIARFHAVETRLAGRLGEASLDEMDAAWESAKHDEV